MMSDLVIFWLLPLIARDLCKVMAFFGLGTGYEGPSSSCPCSFQSEPCLEFASRSRPS